MTSSTSTLHLAGKIVLITGGSKGIGAAISQRLAAQGATLAINYSSDDASATQLLSSLEASHPVPSGPSHSLIKANAAAVPSVQEIVRTAVARYGKIDILIAAAGVLPMRDLASTTETDFDNTFGLNVKGPYFLAQAAAPHMPRGGQIVLFSTSLCAASTVAPGYLLYNATKGAVEQMTRLMAKDLATKGITVNCAAPGPTATELFLRGKPEEVIRGIGKLSPFGRIGEPSEVADAVCLLVGDGARWVSGQILRMNGAMV